MSADPHVLVIDIDSVPHTTEARTTVTHLKMRAQADMTVVVTANAGLAREVAAGNLVDQVRVDSRELAGGYDYVASVIANLRLKYDAHVSVASTNLNVQRLADTTLPLEPAKPAATPTRRPAPRKRRAAGRVLLLDLENVAPSGGERAALEYLRHVRKAAGPAHLRIAVAADPGVRARFAGPCATAGVELRRAPRTRNGSDKVLVSIARSLAGRGYHTFTIASADHYFTRLPGKVRVVANVGQDISHALTARASEVIRVTP